MTTKEMSALLHGEGLDAHYVKIQHGISSGAIMQPPTVALRDMVWEAWEISQARVYLESLDEDKAARCGVKSFRATVYVDTNEQILPNAGMYLDIDKMDGALSITVDEIFVGMKPGVPEGESSDLHVPF